MQAKAIVQDTIKKPIARPDLAQCQPLTFTYDASPSGVDSNLLIMLHGLGDTHLPFRALGKKLTTNLPQTSVLSVRAGNPVPFMDGNSWAWWDVWDAMGQEVDTPDPTSFLSAFQSLLRYLVRPAEEGGGGWRSSSIHLFGYAQGGTAVLEGAIAWTRGQRQELKIQEVGREASGSDLTELGSIVNICGGLLSHPTFSPPLPIPVLHFHRDDKNSPTAKAAVASLRKGYSNVQDAYFPSSQAEAMPQTQAEWTAIMTFWSRSFRNRGKWELDETIYSIGDAQIPAHPSTKSTSASPLVNKTKTGWSPTAEEKGR
ncbi:hypothetical protein CBS101457_003453 [Exobasidium rhododendri]|nr:hypothetical protein CBS101457_003453 [Exobasidium rhododendri]